MLVFTSCWTFIQHEQRHLVQISTTKNENEELFSAPHDFPPYKAPILIVHRAFLLLIAASAVSSGSCVASMTSAELCNNTAEHTEPTTTSSCLSDTSIASSSDSTNDGISPIYGGQNTTDPVLHSSPTSSYLTRFSNQVSVPQYAFKPQKNESEINEPEIMDASIQRKRYLLSKAVFCLNKTEQENENDSERKGSTKYQPSISQSLDSKTATISDEFKTTKSEISDSSSKISILSIPMTRDAFMALGTIIGLSCFGLLHLMKLCVQVRKRCRCKLCRGDYVLLEPLGKGGFGTVFLAKQRRGLTSLINKSARNWNSKLEQSLNTTSTNILEKSENDRDYIESLHKENRLVVLKKVAVSDITDADSIALEGRRLTALRHQHMVCYLDDFLHQEFELGRGVVAESPLCFCVIVMEYCPGGDLKQAIENRWDDLTESQVRTWIYEVARALSSVHENGIIHRDVKSANVFLSNDNSVRLGDFGLSRLFNVPNKMLQPSPASTVSSRDHHKRSQLNRSTTTRNNKHDPKSYRFLLSNRTSHRNKTIVTRHLVQDTRDNTYEFGMSQVGTDCYMAPEIHKDEDYGTACDVWGLGCILLELCSGVFMWEFDTGTDLPFALAIDEDPSLIHHIIRSHTSPILSQKLKRLLLRMLHPDPLRRAPVAEILRKKWLIHHRDLFPKAMVKKRRKETTFGEARNLKNTEDDAQECENWDECSNNTDTTDRGFAMITSNGSCGEESGFVPIQSRSSSSISLENRVRPTDLSFGYRNVAKRIKEKKK